MNARNAFAYFAATALAALVIKKLAEQSKDSPGKAPAPDNSKVAHLVEETLHKHEGEDNPIVHAFEAALEH